jgi:hypothetical protein
MGRRFRFWYNRWFLSGIENPYHRVRNSNRTEGFDLVGKGPECP